VFTNSAAASANFALHPIQLMAVSAIAGTAAQLNSDQRVDLALVGQDALYVFHNDGSGNLGVGDQSPPSLSLIGPAVVSLMVGGDYVDAGAVATDATDGDVSDRIVTVNPVNPAVIGTYTVRYNVTDLSGNAAAPATRTVRVEARQAAGASGGGGGGGGGGSIGLFSLLLLILGYRCRGIAEYLIRGIQQPRAQ
jgi:hypothetical protein